MLSFSEFSDLLSEVIIRVPNSVIELALGSFNFRQFGLPEGHRYGPDESTGSPPSR